MQFAHVLSARRAESRLYDIDRRLLLSTFSIKNIQKVIVSIAEDERPVLIQRICRSVEARNLLARHAIENILGNHHPRPC